MYRDIVNLDIMKYRKTRMIDSHVRFSMLE